MKKLSRMSRPELITYAKLYTTEIDLGCLTREEIAYAITHNGNAPERMVRISPTTTVDLGTFLSMNTGQSPDEYERNVPRIR